MNRYTVEIKSGGGADPYYIELCAIDEAMVSRYMNDPQMMSYNGGAATWRVVFVFPWFGPEG